LITIQFNALKHEKWFASHVAFFDALRLSGYKQVSAPSLWYKSASFYTSLIDLTLSEEEMKRAFNKNYKNEINRAYKLQIVCEIEEDSRSFQTFYNQFAKQKELELFGKTAHYYTPYMCITKAVYEGEVLVMHSYMVDKESQRARLLHSATSLSFTDKKIMGMANKLLHFEDMKYFKKEGMLVYDFGGLNLSSQDAHIIGIDTFKKGFGGEIVQEYNLLSYPLYFLRRLR